MTNYTYKEMSEGNTFYYNAQGFHRTDGPAIEYGNGDKTWWVDGKLHRTDGPAVEYNGGGKEWYVDGKRHRTDGPAIEWSNGYKQWWVDGVELTEDEFNFRYPAKPPESPKKENVLVIKKVVPDFVEINGELYKLTKVAKE
jgi:hypothetical protein